MSIRWLTVVGVALSLSLATEPVSAGWLKNFFCGVVQDAKCRNAWPDQYVPADRETIDSTFTTMTTNGWRRQNMLVDCHFNPLNGELTEAGRLKVRWIVTSCPELHRLVYVHVAGTPEETSARTAAVRQWIAQIAPNEPVPVLATTISADGWPADRVDMINRSYRTSTPAPRLPYIPVSGDANTTAGK